MTITWAFFHVDLKCGDLTIFLGITQTETHSNVADIMLFLPTEWTEYYGVVWLMVKDLSRFPTFDRTKGDDYTLT